MSKTYIGTRYPNDCIVTVNGARLNERRDLRNHSPTGFEWGYHGSGPAQLALAILADHLKDDAKALRLYQDFKRDVISRLHRDVWTLTSAQIDAAVTRIESERTQAAIGTGSDPEAA